jgi:hypothetical protein
MDVAQKQFLESEVLTLSILGALGRSGTYRKGASESDGCAFRTQLRCLLVELAQRYTASITEDEHVNNIQALANQLTATHGAVLAGGRLRFGIAQKALNLYLKYLWCLGCIPLPPHCPFDSIVISALSLESPCAWTALETKEEYVKLVVAAKRKAGAEPLACWELRLWQQAKEAPASG